MSVAKSKDATGKDDKKAEASLGEMGKAIDALEKQVIALSKLHGEASNEPDAEAMKEVDARIKAIAKMLDEMNG